MIEKYDENETMYSFTQEGLETALRMHELLTVNGWTYEQIATYFDYDDKLYIQIILAILYHFADQAGIVLDEAPDNIESLTG